MNGMNLRKLGGFCALGNILAPDIEQLLLNAECCVSVKYWQFGSSDRQTEARVSGVWLHASASLDSAFFGVWWLLHTVTLMSSF